MNFRELLIEISENLMQAKSEKFAKHPIAALIRTDLPIKIKEMTELDEQLYKVDASPGQGNWAEVPWAAIFRKDITESAQYGVYPVYLFRADGSGVYLSLGFGATKLKQEFGLHDAKKQAKKIRKKIRNSNEELENWLTDIDLTGQRETDRGKEYEWASAGAKFYAIDSMPSDEELVSDLQKLISIYAKIDPNILDVQAENNEEQLVNDDKKLIEMMTLPKPFLLLAGISGTGKTRFVRQQAQASGSLKENYCLVPVRPDWHEPSDLLGYISRLGTKGAEYVATDVTQFIAKAWRALFDAGLAFEQQENRLVLSGSGADLKHIKPYWLCLDEMNLAPVEQYFADYLSVLETREWVWDGDNFQYSSDPLLSPVTFEQLDNDNQEALRQTLGLESEDYTELWDHITEHGLGIPLNLIVAGTVNMDETTHGFSRKVIDRALSFDFGEFFPNDFGQFFDPKTQVKTLTFPIWSQAREADLTSVLADTDGAKTIKFLDEVNKVLAGSPFELAYRALNELLLSVVAFSPKDEAELQAVWDDFLMCKVLPRIEGDLDKLQGEEGILHKLEQQLETSLSEIWASTSRPDLYRENVDSTELNVDCRSKKKLAWMKERLASASFTSFWP